MNGNQADGVITSDKELIGRAGKRRMFQNNKCCEDRIADVVPHSRPHQDRETAGKIVPSK